MTLIFEITSGSRAGERVHAHDGFQIGRRNCDLTIQDPKISSKHVRLELRSDSKFWLVDLGSSNGINFKGSKVRELELEEGAEFSLGRTALRIISIGALDSNRAKPGDVETILTPIQTLLRRAQSKANELRAESKADLKPGSEGKISAFDKPILLRFTRGNQTGTEWTLGYGPRTIGKKSVDLKITDPPASDTCFLLEAREGSVVLKNKGRVLINMRCPDEVVIKNGDVIDFSNTQIKVIIED